MNQSLNILHLYSKDMNIYGDNGNALALKKRLEWRGIEAFITAYNPGDEFPENVDIIIGGGGQDSGQITIMKDLQLIGPRLKELAEKDMPMLVICGLYQLFGKFFKTISGENIQGINILNVETYGKNERLIGNIITQSDEFGELIGYENHSGQTYLFGETKPLGKVIKGAGNNLEDAFEGARYKNVIGSYMHGSMLPKNPKVADYLISKALENKYGQPIKLEGLDDTLAKRARNSTKKRPR